MKVKDLIKELRKFDSNQEVKINYNEDEIRKIISKGYCYCSSIDHVLNIEGVDFYKALSVFDEQLKKQSAVIISVTYS